MVGLPRGPAAAVAALVRTRPLPPGRALPASGGRGFPVVRPWRRGRGTRAYPSLLVLIGPSSCASRLAPEVASLFRAVLIYFSAAERAGEWGLEAERGCPRAGGGAAAAGSSPAFWGGPTAALRHPHAPVGGAA